jgi:hypothetical protein
MTVREMVRAWIEAADKGTKVGPIGVALIIATFRDDGKGSLNV